MRQVGAVCSPEGAQGWGCLRRLPGGGRLPGQGWEGASPPRLDPRRPFLAHAQPFGSLQAASPGKSPGQSPCPLPGSTDDGQDRTASRAAA